MLFASLATLLAAGCRDRDPAPGLKLLGNDGCRSLESRMLALPEAGIPDVRKLARGGGFEILFPADHAQYDALNKMAIVGVWVFARQEGTLPIHSGYLLLEAGDRNSLQSIPALSPAELRAVRKHEPGSDVAKRYGEYTQTVFFLVPLRALASRGEIGVRFGENGGDSLRIGSLPVPTRLEYFVKDPFPYEDAERAPDLALARSLAAKYYCWGSK